MTVALLIVDMQNALLPFVWEGPSLVRRLSAVIDRAHARGTLVVVTIQSGDPGSPLEPGRAGAEPARQLCLGTEDLHVTKTATDSFYRSELLEVQGRPADIGGYYRPDDAKTSAVMRPSETFNRVLG